MVELRKRKAPTEAAAPPPPVKKANSVKSSTSSKKGDSAANGSVSATKVATGNTIDLDNFGGEIETNDGEKVTLKKLVEDSKNGVVLFTYPYVFSELFPPLRSHFLSRETCIRRICF